MLYLKHFSQKQIYSHSFSNVIFFNGYCVNLPALGICRFFAGKAKSPQY